MTEPFYAEVSGQSLARWNPCKEGMERFIDYWGVDAVQKGVPLAACLYSNTEADVLWALRGIYPAPPEDFIRELSTDLRDWALPLHRAAPFINPVEAHCWNALNDYLVYARLDCWIWWKCLFNGINAALRKAGPADHAALGDILRKHFKETP